MNRTPNVLLAVTSVLALFLVALSAISTTTPERAPVYLACALFSALGFMILNGMWMHSRKRKPKPLIDRAAPVTLIMAGVWTGLTLQSARAALKPS